MSTKFCHKSISFQNMFLLLRHLTGFRSFSSNHGRIAMGALERSSNTNLREMNSRVKFELISDCNHNHIIVTLDPNKFAEKKQKRLHISGRQSFRPSIFLDKQPSPVVSPRAIYYLEGTTVCYPPNTNAFLYYSIPPGKPRISGELRLRVASSDDPLSFESGSDLLLTTSQPWSRPLYSLSKFYPVLYEKLREERLVPDDLDTALSTLPSQKPRYSQSRILYTLNDKFIVHFNKKNLYLYAITEQGVEKIILSALFFDNRHWQRDHPYTGSALARFERSTHKDTRTIVLRLLKIITPVKCVKPLYDGHICCPKEGELLRKFSNKNSVWSVNIDKSKAIGMVRGLQLLWNT